MRRASPLVLAPFAFAALVACKRPNAESADDASVDASTEIEIDAGHVVLPARCVPSIGGATLADVPADLEIGEAVPTPSGFAIGVLHKVKGETLGSIALVSKDAKSVTFVDLAPPHGDAPPPRPIAIGADLYAAFFARAAPPIPGAKPKTTRDLALYRIADGKAQPTSSIAEQRDESLAYDFAIADKGAIVAWDEDAIGNERGDIKIAILGADTKSVASTRIASPDGSDAELPRVAPRRGGWWLAWVASRLEAPDAGLDPGQEIERPGEKRRFRWLELVALDANGAQVGAVKRLTAANGHVSMFDLAPRANAAGASVSETLDVIARDDEQAIDGAGGRIVRITIAGDKVDPPIAIVSESVGRGAPDLLDPSAGGNAWLAFSDTHDRVRILPLDATRTPAALPSAEDALDRARVLFVGATTPGPDGGSTTEVLAAFPEEPLGQIRFVACSR